MGSIQIDHQNIYDSIIYVLEKTELESFSKGFFYYYKEMKKIEEVLKNAEMLRYTFSSHFGLIIYDSGAIVLKEPSFNDCLMGLLFQIARDHGNETFNLVNITESAPFIELKSNNLTQSIKTTYNNIVTYCNECNLIKSDISLCKTNILNILMKFNEEYRGWESEHYNYYGKDNNRLRYFHEVTKRNLHKIKYSLQLIEYINNKIYSLDREGSDFFYAFLNERLRNSGTEKFLQIHNEYKNSEKKSLIENDKDIFYKYSTSEKFDEIFDWRKLYFTKIKLNKIFKISNDNQIKSIELKKTRISEVHENTEIDNLNKRIEELIIKNDELEKIKLFFKKQSINKVVILIHKILPIRNTLIEFNYQFRIGNEKENYPKSMCFDYDNQKLVIGSKNGFIHFFDLGSQEILASLKSHESSVTALCCLNNGRYCLSGDNNGNLVKFDLIQHVIISRHEISSGSRISSIINPLNGENFYVSCGKKIICLDYNDCSEVLSRSIKLEEEITKILHFKDENFLIVALKTGSIKKIQLNTNEIQDIYDDKSKINDIIGCKIDGINYIIFCTMENKIVLYNFNSNKQEKTINLKEDNIVRNLVYCYDNKHVIASFTNGKIILSNFKEDKIKELENKRLSKIKCSAYFGDSLNFAFGNVDGYINLYFMKINF